MCGGSNEPDYDPGNITDLARHGINYRTTREHIRVLYQSYFHVPCEVIDRGRITTSIEPLFQICHKSIQKLSRVHGERKVSASFLLYTVSKPHFPSLCHFFSFPASDETLRSTFVNVFICVISLYKEAFQALGGYIKAVYVIVKSRP